MSQINLEIPKELLTLVEDGIWPKDEKESMRQNIVLLITRENLKKVAPDEDYIYFYAPPFEIVDSLIKENREFWIEHGAIDSIEPEKCLMIGDFGLGSDAAIILDYSKDLSKPTVKRQVWSNGGNYWDTIAPSFKEFVAKIELKIK